MWVGAHNHITLKIQITIIATRIPYSQRICLGRPPVDWVEAVRLLAGKANAQSYGEQSARSTRCCWFYVFRCGFTQLTHF